jgi:hypothetical protein
MGCGQSTRQHRVTPAPIPGSPTPSGCAFAGAAGAGGSGARVTDFPDVQHISGGNPPPPPAQPGAISPAREVLEGAESRGPEGGWVGGFLTRQAGFLDPDPAVHFGGLRQHAGGAQWVSLSLRIPGLLRRHALCAAVGRLARFPADDTAIPNRCLNEAVHVLGIIAYS